MSVTLKLPTELEHRLQTQANSKQLTLNQFVEELIATTLGYREIIESINQLPEEALPELLTFIEQLQTKTKPSQSYSFIGLGHSGKGNLSTSVETTLAESTDRQEGWRLP